MAGGMPAKPATGSDLLRSSGAAFWSFTWTGRRPDWNADREGEQNL